MKKIILFFILWSWTVLSYAGSFDVSPIRVDLSPQNPIVTLQVINQADTTTTLQAYVKQWSQQNDNDDYQDQKRVVIIPPLVKIPPHKTQLFRVALTDPSISSSEQTYRVYLHEVVQPLRKDRFLLQVATRVGIPVFVTPNKLLPTEMKASIRKTPRAGHWIVKLNNPGNQHLHILQLSLSAAKKTIAKQAIYLYVLPNSTRQWTIKAAEAVAPPLTLTATLDTGSTITTTIDKIDKSTP